MGIKTIDYFRETVRAKRPYLTDEVIASVLKAPLVRRVQSDGRVRLWSRVETLGGRAVRVVLLPDGQTVHNAFLDRDPPDELNATEKHP